MENQQFQLSNPQPPPPPNSPQSGVAVVLELIPGICAQTFGIGNIYAGNVTGGILMMVGYWVSCAVNFVLCFFLVGFVTWPLTWIAFLVFCPICANNAALARAAGPR